MGKYATDGDSLLAYAPGQIGGMADNGEKKQYHGWVLPGVTIGYGSIVGADSVVTKDVPSMTIMAGNPARVIRKIDPNK